MGGRDVEGHFDGSDKAPHQLTLSTPDESKWTMAHRERNEDYLWSERKWQHDEKVVCAQLAQVMSDLLLIHIQHAKSVTEMWSTIVSEFNRKGHMVQVDLHWKMMEKHALDTGAHAPMPQWNGSCTA